jgi:hypothetical protein
VNQLDQNVRPLRERRAILLGRGIVRVIWYIPTDSTRGVLVLGPITSFESDLVERPLPMVGVPSSYLWGYSPTRMRMSY